MNLTLDDLINSLQKSASEDTEKKEKKDEKEADKDMKDADKKDKEGEKKEKEAEKENSKEDKDDEQCKEAADRGAALAKEVMEKFASQTTELKENTMNKQASAAGVALAEAILKSASVGDMTTSNGVAVGTTNKQIADSAAIVSQDDAKIQATPGTNGNNEGGTLSQIFDAIVADAKAQGPASFDQVAPTPVTASTPAHIEGSDVPSLEGQEKAAAVSALVEQGFDFDDAVSMVKAAAEEIEYEETTQIKQAAIGALMDRGVDFNDAVSMVKSAGAMTTVAKGAMKGAKGMSMGAKAAIGGAAAGAVAGGAVAAKKIGQEKKAALDSLIAQGVDYDVAAELVAAKSLELYGM